jgi:hypothetical protein
MYLEHKTVTFTTLCNIVVETVHNSIRYEFRTRQSEWSQKDKSYIMSQNLA